MLARNQFTQGKTGAIMSSAHQLKVKLYCDGADFNSMKTMAADPQIKASPPIRL